MNSKELYPSWLLQQRSEINKLLIKKINSDFVDSFLASEVQRCVLPGRKIRSILFLQTLQSLNPNAPIELATDIIFSIELSHAASVLVDDILDSDQFRHGVVATEVLWGNSKSVLFAHLLSSIAIKNLAIYDNIQNKLVEVYGSMCVGEMYDIFLPAGNWIYEGYDLRTFQKTSALFQFALSAAQHLAGHEFAGLELAIIGKELGMLYQLSNDFHDWQPNNILKRHLQTQSWPITFSFPLSVYLKKYRDKGVATYLEQKSLSFDQWMGFLSVIWNSEIKEECQNTIHSTQRKLIERISQGKYSQYLKELYEQMVNLIASEAFWYHIYEIS